MTDETNPVAETLGINSNDSLDWDAVENPEHDNFMVEDTEEVFEDEVEEAEESEDEVVEEEETEEAIEVEGDEEVAEEDEVSSDSQLEEVNSNLKKAMHSERTKRKEASERVTQLEQEMALLKGSSSGDDYDALVAQIKELGLDDLVDIKEKQQLDPRVQQMLNAQEQQRQAQEQEATRTEFMSNMQTDVGAKVGGYKNIDANDNAQGEALANMIIAGVVQGGELEDVVDSSLKTLDSLLGTTLKKRQPAVQPKRKVKAATKTTASAKQRVSKQKQKAGNFDDIFNRIADGFVGDN
ncbi:MAG: hypothetical protein GQ474_00490 [Sulfurimonas sp.]|nr:hypothetical protein [Sulfurimonas sp.]